MHAQHQPKVAGQVLPFVARSSFAASRMEEVGVDQFLADRADEMVGLGHWVSVKRTTQGGNRSAIVEMVTVAGQAPEPGLAETNYTNTLALFIEPTRCGMVVMSVSTRGGRRLAETKVPAGTLCRAMLVEAFEAFRGLASREASQKLA